MHTSRASWQQRRVSSAVTRGRAESWIATSSASGRIACTTLHVCNRTTHHSRRSQLHKSGTKHQSIEFGVPYTCVFQSKILPVNINAGGTFTKCFQPDITDSYLWGQFHTWNPLYTLSCLSFPGFANMRGTELVCAPSNSSLHM